ncbi:MAG: hypothetical protein EXR76_20280 [Myxococcales bacterium]|nr:hypothetical protein [Myxococcales bacterium]
MSEDDRSLARLMARSAAVLLLVGLLTGALVAFAMTGKLDAEPHAMLAAHLNAILGTFWILGVAFTLPMLSFGAKGKRHLAALVIFANASNWLITLVKSLLGVVGVSLSGDGANDSVYVALNLAVVLPSLLAAFCWIRGLSGSPTPAA